MHKNNFAINNWFKSPPRSLSFSQKLNIFEKGRPGLSRLLFSEYVHKDGWPLTNKRGTSRFHVNHIQQTASLLMSNV